MHFPFHTSFLLLFNSSHCVIGFETGGITDSKLNIVEEFSFQYCGIGHVVQTKAKLFTAGDLPTLSLSAQWKIHPVSRCKVKLFFKQPCFANMSNFHCAFQTTSSLQVKSSQVVSDGCCCSSSLFYSFNRVKNL